MSVMHVPFVIDDNLDDAQFYAICTKLEELSGIKIEPRKRAMVISRLAKRSKEIGIKSLAEYCSHLLSSNGSMEYQSFIEALTTNMTRFNREERHFLHLRNHVLPKLYSEVRKSGRVRLWSAGCSSGEEAYNIAFEALDLDEKIFSQNFKILATDIDLNMLKIASRGAYPEESLSVLGRKRIDRYFGELDASTGKRTVDSKIGNYIKFARLNLNGAWPMTGQFNVIMCRNVAIYFSEDIQLSLWKKFSDALCMGGYLYIGHSEVAQNFEEIGLEVLGRGIYRKMPQ